MEKTEDEKDLCMHVILILKPYVHAAKVAAKANAMLGRMKKTTAQMDQDIFIGYT